MLNLTLRPLEVAPEVELSALQRVAFSEYEPSLRLAEVLASEAASRVDKTNSHVQAKFGIAAFRGDVLVGWTQGHHEGANQFYMLNSGVAAAERRRGVYSLMVRAVLEHAKSQGYATVRSRHTATNSGVIIAKLQLGFQVSGFEYSEVYGPLVQLTHLVSEARRTLYRDRTVPLRAASR